MTDILLCLRGSNGPPGPPRPARTEERRPGQNQPDIAPVSQTISGVPAIPVTPPVAWLEALLQDIRISYTEAPDDAARTRQLQRLEWLQKLVLAARATQTSAEYESRCDGLSLAVDALISFADLGLDIFGRSHGLVSLLSREFIASILDSQIAALKVVERGRDALADQSSVQDRRLAELRAASDALDESVRRDDQQLESIVQQIRSMENEINLLLADLAMMWGELFESDAAFRQAVATRARCEFEGVVQFVTLVSTVVATGGAAAGVASALASAKAGVRLLNDQAGAVPNFKFKQVRDDFKAISEVFRPVKGSVEEFRKTYQEMRAELDKRPGASRPDQSLPAISSDHAKILANKEEFEEQIAPFLDVPEAQRYRALMVKFLAITETRNNRILEHDAAVALVKQVFAEREIRRTAVSTLASTSAETFEGDLGRNLDLLKRQLATLQLEALRQIIDVQRATDYVTLERRAPLRIGNLSTPFVTAAAQTARTDYYKALERVGQPLSPTATVRIPLIDVATPSDLQEIAADRVVMLAIPSTTAIDPFRNWYAVQTVGISIADQRGGLLPNNLTLFFENQGRSLVFDEARSPRSFTHVAKVRGLYSQDARGTILSNGIVLDDDDRFVGVGPYGPWRMQLSANRDFRPAALRRVALIFQIRGRVAPIRQ